MQEEIFGRELHPCYRSGILPRQASGLFYNNAMRGETFAKGFFVARGAQSLAIQGKQATGLVIMNSKYVLGLKRCREDGSVELMSKDELQSIERSHNRRVEAEMGARRRLAEAN